MVVRPAALALNRSAAKAGTPSPEPCFNELQPRVLFVPWLVEGEGVPAFAADLFSASAAGRTTILQRGQLFDQQSECRLLRIEDDDRTRVAWLAAVRKVHARQLHQGHRAFS